MPVTCRKRWRSRRSPGVFALLAAAMLSGCGQEGPVRYRLSGAITFEGKPVPAGMISFEPKNKGIGGGFAPIINGAYDTDRTGRGHLGGEHTILISGFEGVKDATDPDSPAIPMFKPVTLTRELPTETATIDFALPETNSATAR